MTRKKNLKAIDNSMGDANVFTFVKQDMIDLVNKMHDAFESRTCENCKHSDGNHPDTKACDVIHGWIPKDFGCLKFEGKDI